MSGNCTIDAHEPIKFHRLTFITVHFLLPLDHWTLLFFSIERLLAHQKDEKWKEDEIFSFFSNDSFFDEFHRRHQPSCCVRSFVYVSSNNVKAYTHTPASRHRHCHHLIFSSSSSSVNKSFHFISFFSLLHCLHQLMRSFFQLTSRSSFSHG